MFKKGGDKLKNIIKQKLIHITLLIMLMSVLYLSVNLPQSSAWFTFADDNDQSIVVGSIELDISEGSSNNFTTSINTSSITVLEDDTHFNDVVTVLEITFVNTGTIPLVIDANLSEPSSGNSPGLLYYVKTSNFETSDYETELLSVVNNTDFTTLKSSLESLNGSNLLYLENNVVLNPLDEYTIEVIIWIDYHEANLGTTSFELNQYLINLSLFYYQFVQ
jgi:hypothetical protein